MTEGMKLLNRLAWFFIRQFISEVIQIHRFLYMTFSIN